MALLAKGIWIVVADGERALFLVNQGTPDKPSLTLHEKMQGEGATMEQVDRPGRMQDTGRQQLSAMEMTDHDRIARDRFAETVAERINALVLKGKIGRLVMVAPPQTLGGLRAAISDQTQAAMVAEIDKDLTQHPLPKIGQLVASHIDPL